MKGGLGLHNVDSAVDLDVLFKFSLRILIIFAIIFLIAVITPKIAKLIDSRKKKRSSEGEKEETYGLRSIYELPPAPEDDSDYDLDAPEEQDEDDYLLEEEISTETTVVEISAEPIYLFSFDKIDYDAYDLSRRTVRFGRKFVPDLEPMDFSMIAFGMKNHPAMYEPVQEPDEEDEDDEFYAGKPPIPYAPFVEHFFDDEPDEEPSQDEDDDLPWFMK